MFVTATALVAGVLLLQQLATLPDVLWSVLAVVILLCWWRLPSMAPAWAFCIGFLWALVSAHWQATPQLQADLEGEDLIIEGVVADLPDVDSRRTRFLFDVEKIEIRGVSRPPPERVRLSWYRNPPELSVGKRWRLNVRLRRPRGLMNPYGFDYEGWLYSQGINGTGYVRENPANRVIGNAFQLRYRLNRLRQSIRDRVAAHAGPGRSGAVLIALTIGDRTGLEDSDWRLFRQTGTSHLVAISGLHIGIIAGLGFFAGRRASRLLSRTLNYLPADAAGALLALLFAGFYTALAGFSIPTQRALVMLVLALGGVLLKRPVRPFYILSAALVAVVLLDPLAVLSIGFWLSFGAVAAILFAVSWRLNISKLTAISGIQWYVFVGLIPPLLLFGLDISLLSPMVNILAVPLFSFIIVPGALISTLLLLLLGEAAAPLLAFTLSIIEVTCGLLEAIADKAPLIRPGGGIAIGGWIAGVAGILLLLAPRGIPGRWLGLLFLLPLLGEQQHAPEKGGLQLTVLDVGQGMAVVVRTSEHVLLYDTGPRSFGGFDAGTSVVLPYLRGVGISRIDRLYVSNGDSDHSGGLQALIGGIEIGEIHGGEPSRIDAPGVRPCIAGDRWDWDGIGFELLHPSTGRIWKGNDASCVLRIDTGERRILLTGDIEGSAESQLTTRMYDDLESDLLVIPHHGSESSSTRAFVEATRPSYAIVSSGYGNRYGFPRDRVVERWKARGARVLNTAESGAISFQLTPDGRIAEPEQFRESDSHYWTARPNDG